MAKKQSQKVSRKKLARSSRNKASGKYVRQRERTAANKARRIAKQRAAVS